MVRGTLTGGLMEVIKKSGDRRDDVVMQAFKNALPFDKSGLYNSLTLKPPETVQDLLVRAERYATVQEDSKYKQQGYFSNDRAKQEQQQHDKDRKKHNKDAKTGVSQSQKQDGRPSKDLTLPRGGLQNGRWGAAEGVSKGYSKDGSCKSDRARCDSCMSCSGGSLLIQP
ncbi:hypothetical protein IFM89_020981 [Coptis chinensis]|uniref:Uncharacterized protein n=1 Tax=Coptis chinensis TaxID=261450 RepID=A0A835IDG5_9MAGN|nr:hypothetical protein IFM89_020981 [Coptis chinensis]